MFTDSFVFCTFCTFSHSTSTSASTSASARASASTRASASASASASARASTRVIGAKMVKKIKVCTLRDNKDVKSFQLSLAP